MTRLNACEILIQGALGFNANACELRLQGALVDCLSTTTPRIREAVSAGGS